MIDLRGKEVNDSEGDHYDNESSSGGGDNSNDSRDDIVNTSESIPGQEYGKFYQQYLYRLLPAVYQEYDTKENNVLQEYLKIIAGPAASIRRDIDSLLNNFFINSCNDWVIPYIGDLIAAKVVPNSSLNSRLDVQNTIRWRKLKGTQTGLVDLIRNTINANAKIKEAFSYCSSCPHLAFAIDETVNRPPNFVDLRDQDTLNNIDTENDSALHTIDVREPTHAKGWYNIKNVLLFLPQLNVYHVGQVEAQKDGDAGLQYYFSSITPRQQQPSSSSLSSSSPSSPSSPSSSSTLSSTSDYFALYDLDEGRKITATEFDKNPYKYFGSKRGLSIKTDNILAACSKPPTFSPVNPNDNPQENRVTIGAGRNGRDDYGRHYGDDGNDISSNTDPDFVGIHRAEGIRILEPGDFNNPNNQFIIRLYSYSEEHGLVELANYDTSKMSYRLLPAADPKKIRFGTILVSIEPDSALVAAEFPETVIAIRDSQPIGYIGEKNLADDNRLSKYRNALYIYLPSVVLNNSKKKYFFVDKKGSTYEVQMINGRYNITSFRLGKGACGQIYPPRELTYSIEPLHNFAELNRFTGIKAADAKKYGKWTIDIEAIAINRERKQAWKIGKLQIKAGSLQYVNEKEVWIRWRIILGTLEPGSKEDSYHINKEHLLSTTHFKTTRLDLERNLKPQPEKSIREIVESVLPREILSEYASGKEVGSFHIDKKRTANSDNNYTEEYEVKIEIRPDYHQQFEYITSEIKNNIENNLEFTNDTKLMLRVSRSTLNKTKKIPIYPASEIILTNSFGTSILVYLPQMIFAGDRSEYDLYITSDGSTSFEEGLSTPARESAGQVVPIAGKYPLQQRTPVYMNLADWQSSAGTNMVHSGKLAIDPEHGRFAFSRQDYAGEGNNSASFFVTADYNYAFSHHIGAGAYDRRDDLKKATKWISKKGHVPYDDALPSKTFRTLVDALVSAEDDDVIQIEDSSIYEEVAISNITLNATIRDLTLQAANRIMPTIKLTEKTGSFRLVLSQQTKPCSDPALLSRLTNEAVKLTLNGILVTGGPLTLQGNFCNLVLNSCTIDPGYDSKRFRGIMVEHQGGYNDHAANTEMNDGYSTQNPNRPSKEISLNKSISGGIVVDDTVSTITVEDSIVDNLGGSAIHVNETNNRENSNLKLEARRSDILSRYQDAYVLKLKNICCSDSILTNRVDVKTKGKQDQAEDDRYTNNCNSIRHSRYEQRPTSENIGKDNNAIVDCTIEMPIFISTTFGHPAYLHLDHMSSKSILEGAENTLEMGAFNENYTPLRMRNLNLKLREFLPLGIRAGVAYTY